MQQSGNVLTDASLGIENEVPGIRSLEFSTVSNSLFAAVSEPHWCSQRSELKAVYLERAVAICQVPLTKRTPTKVRSCK